MIYYGRVEEARQYFIDMGWEPANRQTTADFLVAVTDPYGRTAREGFENRVPRTADDFVNYFQKHELYVRNRADIAACLSANVLYDDGEAPDALAGFPVVHAPREEKELTRQSYIKSAHAEHAKHARLASPYTISIAAQVREVMIRRVQILRGNWAAQVTLLGSYIFQA